MPNDVALEIYYDGAWHDLVMSDDVLAEQEIVITRGTGPGAGGLSPTTITARLNNDDDLLRPSNPESPLYGKAGRGTPIRVSVGGSIRACGEASSYKSGQTRDFRARPKRGKAWVDLEASGVLARINQWGESLRSPFYRYNARIPNLAGYWPLEDENGTDYAFTPVAGATSGLVQNLAFGSQYRPAGSDPVADVDAAPVSTEGYFVPGPASSTAGWQISWVQKMTTFSTSETYTLMFWETSNGASWSLIYSGGNLVLLGTGSVSVNYVVATSFNFGEKGWVLWDIEASYSGGTTTIEAVFRGEQDSIWNVFSTSYSGVTGTLRKWFVSGLTITDMALGHVVGVNVNKDVQDLGSSARIDAFKGHPSEITAYRFYRLFELELGIPVYVSADWASSTLMGAQRSGPLADIVAEMNATDDSIVVESRDENNRLYMLSRPDRYNQTSISIDVSELPAPPAEVTDDNGVWNVAKLSVPDGAEYEARDATGPMGTQDSPDGIGERIKQLEVNPAADFQQHANWWLKRGTVDLPRYPQVVVNLAALDASRVSTIEAIDIGDVIEITGYREGSIRLHVLAYTEVIGWPNARRITFVCAPDQQFQVGVWDAAASRYDLRTCTLSTPAGTTATTLTLAITDDEAWSSTSAYDLLISGELVGVPVGGMNTRTGTPGAYTQTLTGAIRSRNGIRKTLPVGAEVHVSTPGRWAL